MSMDVPQILFEDADILVLNKPSGMTVNNADSNREEETVQKWVEGNVQLTMGNGQVKKDVISNEVRDPSGISPHDVRRNDINAREGEYNIEEEFQNRGGIVHRLDKETSGVLVVAKNPESFGKLKEQFMSRTTQKSYLALTHGKIVPSEGEINAPVGRLPFNRMHFGVLAGGREAVTRYQVISNFHFPSSIKNREVLSLVQLFPKTGRTHQIRVHLKYINHPIVADPLYAGRKTGREDRKKLSRLFLHAEKLTFTHPTSGKEMTVEAPLPRELGEFIGKLEKINE